MPDEQGNGRVTIALLGEKMDTLLERVENMGEKLDEIRDPEKGIYPKQAQLERLAAQNEKDHRIFWRLFQIIGVVILIILAFLGPEALAWALKVI